MGTKIEIPDRMSGTIAGNAVYTIGKSTYKFGSSDSQKESVEWDSFDFIEIGVAVEYALLVPGQAGDFGLTQKTGKGRFGFSAKWSATFKDGSMTLEPVGKQPKILGANKSDGEIVVSIGADAACSKPTEKNQYVELTFVPVVGFEDDGLQVGLSFAGASVAKSIGKSKASVSEQVTLKIELSVTGKPEAERPIPSIPAALLSPDIVYFEGGEPTNDGEKALRSWANLVKEKNNEAMRAVILGGDVPIELEAYSAKGDKKEATAMLDRVKKDLQSSRYLGTKLNFGGGSTGKASKGKVEIAVDKGKATRALEKLLRGK